MDKLCFVETVNGFSQGIVVGVAFTADRRFNASLCQPVSVADGNILAAAVRMMNQCLVTRACPKFCV